MRYNYRDPNKTKTTARNGERACGVVNEERADYVGIMIVCMKPRFIVVTGCRFIKDHCLV